MKKEWYSSKELAEIDGLPSTTQGVNRKARVEKWNSRKRTGVQGKAIEYHIESLPEYVRTHLHVREAAAEYKNASISPMDLWLTTYQRLTEKEQYLITEWILRNGIDGLIEYIQTNHKPTK